MAATHQLRAPPGLECRTMHAVNLQLDHFLDMGMQLDHFSVMDAKMDSKLKKFDTKWETGLAEMEARDRCRISSSRVRGAYIETGEHSEDEWPDHEFATILQETQADLVAEQQKGAFLQGAQDAVLAQTAELMQAASDLKCHMDTLGKQDQEQWADIAELGRRLEEVRRLCKELPDKHKLKAELRAQVAEDEWEIAKLRRQLDEAKASTDAQQLERRLKAEAAAARAASKPSRQLRQQCVQADAETLFRRAPFLTPRATSITPPTSAKQETAPGLLLYLAEVAGALAPWLPGVPTPSACAADDVKTAQQSAPQLCRRYRTCTFLLDDIFGESSSMRARESAT